MIYEDAALSSGARTLQSDGVVLWEDGFFIFTLDGAQAQIGYTADAPAPLAPQELAAHAAREGGLEYGGVRLFPLQLAARGYAMRTYGFPGLPEGYALDGARRSAKAALGACGTIGALPGMRAGGDYAEGEILVHAATRHEAALAADSFGGELLYWLDWGLAKIRLNGHTTLQAVAASADPQAELFPAYPNLLYRAVSERRDAPGDAAPRADEVSLAVGEAAPTAGTWRTRRANDPFLQDPGSAAHLRQRYRDLTDGYQYLHDIVGTWSAWGLTRGSPSVRVAVIDTGVLAAHEDIPNDVIDLLDPNRLVDCRDVGGAWRKLRLGDAFGVSSSVGGLDDPHGTHVAGIIAGTADNGLGGAGIAPGARLMAYRCTDSRGAIAADLVADGLRQAVAQGATLVNLSFGGPYYDAVLDEAVQHCVNAGVAVLAAAGDGGAAAYNYPASLPNVISVAATDAGNARAYSSGYGAATVSAPGSAVLSATFGGGNNSLYQSWDGTAAACAAATGCAALYYSARGTRDLNGDGDVNLADVRRLRDVLADRANVTAIIGGASGMGAGVVNVGKIFAGMVTRPSFALEPEGTSAKAAPSAASLRITTGWNGAFIVYTVDGPNPAVKSGAVTVGTVAHGAPNEAGTAYAFSLPLAGLGVGRHTVRALNVNASGKASGVSSFSFVVDNLQVDSIAIAPSCAVLAAGKSARYAAAFTPASLSARAAWRLEGDEGAARLTQNRDGTCALKALKAGEVTLCASLNGLEARFAVTVVPYAARKLTLAQTSVTLNAGQTLAVSPRAVTLADAARTVLPDARSRGFTYKSSRPSVATVDADGTVTAVSPGTARITATVADGGGASATLTVTVKRPVHSVRLDSPNPARDGAYRLAAGKTVRLRAAVLPADATNRRLSWSVTAAPHSAGVKITSGGALSAPKGYAGRVTVVCASLDDPAKGFEAVFEVGAPDPVALALTGDDPKLLRDRKGKLTGAKLFTFDLGGGENALRLGATVGDDVPVRWSSGNPKIAAVDADGNVTAVGAGATSIACEATDGSGRRASLRLTVAVPVSGVSVYVGANGSSSPHTTLAYGKSRRFRAACMSAYGAPTDKRVRWTYELRVYGAENLAYADMEAQGAYAVVDADEAKRYVRLSANGTLTVLSALSKRPPPDPARDRYFVKLTATAADGSGARGVAYAEVVYPEAFLALGDGTRLYREDAGQMRYCKTLRELTNGYRYTLRGADGRATREGELFFAADRFTDIGSSSTRPAVATWLGARYAGGENRFWYRDDAWGYLYAKAGGTYYPLYCTRFKIDGAGTTVVKLFKNDGTGKAISYRITVRAE